MFHAKPYALLGLATSLMRPKLLKAFYHTVVSGTMRKTLYCSHAFSIEWESTACLLGRTSRLVGKDERWWVKSTSARLLGVSFTLARLTYWHENLVVHGFWSLILESGDYRQGWKVLACLALLWAFHLEGPCSDVKWLGIPSSVEHQEKICTNLYTCFRAAQTLAPVQ